MPLELLWFPVIVLVQLVFTIGLALFLSALTVHFRDLKDLLGNLVQLWFFATPIIYPMQLAPADMRWLAEPQPDDAHHELVSGGAVLRRPARTLEVAAGAGRAAVDRRVPGRATSCSIGCATALRRKYDARHRRHQRLEGLPPLRAEEAVRDAEVGDPRAAACSAI